jgi:tetratricopeptide (TPR) repeat protein
VRYTYGKDGKPLYLSRPEDSPAQSRHILNTLTRRLGPKGFHFLTAIDDLADELGREAPEPVRVVSYEITEEPLPDATFEQLPSDVQAQINALHDEVLKARPRKALAALRTLVTQYPDVAQIYNYLYVACYNLGERAEAARVVQETVQRFPDYLFGHISLAEECLQRGEPEKIAEIFRGKLDLKLLYPGRARFHLSEVLSFNSVVARYYHALGDREQAERSYELMRQLRPNHPSTRLVGRTLHGSRFRVWLREKLKLPGH